MFFYQTQKISVSTDTKDSFFDPMKCDATKCYLDHYQNLLVLIFMSNNGTIQEKKQAFLEIEICKRKMKYWQKQPHFNQQDADKFKEKMNKSGKHNLLLEAN